MALATRVPRPSVHQRAGGVLSGSAEARPAEVSARVAVVHPLVQDSADNETKGNRFLLSAVAFQRSKQLQGGAPCRIERNGHKSTYLAVLEVLANTISWSQLEAAERAK